MARFAGLNASYRLSAWCAIWMATAAFGSPTVADAQESDITFNEILENIQGNYDRIKDGRLTVREVVMRPGLTEPKLVVQPDTNSVTRLSEPLSNRSCEIEKRRELESLPLAEMQRLDYPYRLWDQSQ